MYCRFMPEDISVISGLFLCKDGKEVMRKKSRKPHFEPCGISCGGLPGEYCFFGIGLLAPNKKSRRGARGNSEEPGQ